MGLHYSLTLQVWPQAITWIIATQLLIRLYPFNHILVQFEGHLVIFMKQ